MPDLTRFRLEYRHPALVDFLIRRALTGDAKLTESVDWLAQHFAELVPEKARLSTRTITNTIAELHDAGIIRTIRDRQGRITAHRTTVLGLGYLQGRTTWPVPRNTAEGWTWWSPTPENLETAPTGGLVFTHPDDLLDDLDPIGEVDDPTIDDEAQVAALLEQYRQAHAEAPPVATDPPPSSSSTEAPPSLEDPARPLYP